MRHKPEPIIRSKIPELDTIRGIAIAMVLIFHGFGLTFSPVGLPWYLGRFIEFSRIGRTGVQLFFVLSGFLITGILLDSRARPDFYRRFYIRRALRILPAYCGLLVLLVWLRYTSWMRSDHVDWQFLVLSFFYLSNVAPLLGVAMQYQVLWSLAVEEHFYIVWPAAVRHLSKRRLVICAGLICLLVPLIRAVSIQYDHLGRVNFYTWCNADALAFGALLALLVRNPNVTRRHLWSTVVLGLALSALILAIGRPFGIAFGETTVGFALRDSAMDLLYASTLLASLLIGTTNSRFVVNRPSLQFLGRISYGLYLFHMLGFHLYDELAGKFAPSVVARNGHFNIMVLRFLVACTASIIFAYLSRRYYEEPFLAIKDRISRSHVGTSPAELNPSALAA